MGGSAKRGFARASTTATRSWAIGSVRPRCTRCRTRWGGASGSRSRAPRAFACAEAISPRCCRSIRSFTTSSPRSAAGPPPSPWAAQAERRPQLGATPIQSKDIGINEGIRVREVRVVSADGEQLGILPIAQALELARQGEMDLGEVAAEAGPPVCRIMDFGKYKDMQARRQKDE